MQLCQQYSYQGKAWPHQKDSLFLSFPAHESPLWHMEIPAWNYLIWWKRTCCYDIRLISTSAHGSLKEAASENSITPGFESRVSNVRSTQCIQCKANTPYTRPCKVHVMRDVMPSCIFLCRAVEPCISTILGEMSGTCSLRATKPIPAVLSS